MLIKDKTRLEIGGGKNQAHPDWVQLDIRPLDNVDVVVDAQDLSMFQSGIFDYIYASHVIEHISWRDTEKVLSEWVRVLSPGGTLELVVPDFDRVMEQYIKQEVLPVTASWKSSQPITIKRLTYYLGGGQDYPENFHKAHWSAGWYQLALTLLGCRVEIEFICQDTPSPSFILKAVKK